MIKRIGAILVVLGLLMGCVASAIVAEPESVIVQVNAGSLSGSGVIYQKNEDLLIVATAAHVLTQVTEGITVTFSDGFAMTTDDYYISSHSDLAFLNIPLSSLPKNRSEQYIPVQIDKAAFDGLQGGAEVVFRAVGTDNAVSVKDTETQSEATQETFNEVADANNAYTGAVLENWIFAEDFGQYMMILQGDVEPGMSGGGVFDTAGNFLGIICGESELGEVAAVPLSIIEAEYLGVY